MTKRTRNKAISYTEVDSDQDWPSSADEDEVGGRAGTSKGGKGKGKGRARDSGGDSYGAAKPPKKKARRFETARKGKNKKSAASMASPEPEKPEYNADLLLELPFDMLSEICSHLEVPDLISLSKVSHDFRKLFLSPSSRSIWAAKRRRDGFELAEGMGEVAFAVLVHGSNCHECGAPANSLLKLGTRLCPKCAKERLVDNRQIRKEYKHLHPSSIFCVQADRGLYRLADLESVSAQLHDLEDEDEETRNQNQRFTLWTTKSRRRSSAPEGEVKAADAVESFVEQKKKEVAQSGEGMQKIIDRQAELARQLRTEQLLKREKAREEAEAKTESVAQELLAKHDWTTEQVNVYKDSWYIYLPRRQLVIPSAAPAEDPAAWSLYQSGIQAVLDEEEAERQAQPGRQARLSVLEDLFDTLKQDLKDELAGVFPSFTEFQMNPDIRPLWHPADAQFAADDAAKQLPVGRKVFRSFAERIRVEAIRSILAAQENKSLGSFSSSPSDYPASKYDSAWLSRLIHTFFLWRSGYVSPLAYPAAAARCSYGNLQYRLARAISYKQVCAIKAVIKAAGLDINKATKDEMDEKGGTFRWPACPSKSSRQSQLGWFAMVQLLLRKGPGVKKLAAGETVKLEYTPPASTDRKGKSRAFDIFDVDSDGDLGHSHDDAEDVDDEEEEDEAEQGSEEEEDEEVKMEEDEEEMEEEDE